MSAENRNDGPILIISETNQFDCGICLDVMYNAASCSPCLHSFCAGCIAEFFKKDKKCPICRVESSELLTNRYINELVEKFLEQNPERQRSEMHKLLLDKSEREYLSKALYENQRVIDKLSRRTEKFFVDLKRKHEQRGQRISRRLLKLRGPRVSSTNKILGFVIVAMFVTYFCRYMKFF